MRPRGCDPARLRKRQAPRALTFSGYGTVSEQTPGTKCFKRVLKVQRKAGYAGLFSNSGGRI